MIKLLFLLIVLQITLIAKVPILLTKSAATLVQDKEFTTLFQSKFTQNETTIIDSFLQNKANFALIRKDMLEKLALLPNHRPYFIIGAPENRMQLLFLSNSNHYNQVLDLTHKKIIVDPLSLNSRLYLKQILKENSLLFSVNIASIEPTQALHTLKNDNAHAIFTLALPNKIQKLKSYIKPYPKGFLPVLNTIPELTCNKKRCSIQYYIIAAARVGNSVMHNISTQLNPLWTKEKSLISNIGKYYIDTSYEKPKSPPTYANTPNIEKKSLNLPKFGRTPWMDFAVKEAILGKGSAENVFPMLDLSYKYIRFSKGDKGITTAPNDSKMGAWCAAYICWTLDESGYKVHPKGRMASQSFRYFKNKLYRKINTPIFGAIALYTSKRNPKHGHVGYLFGHTKSKKNILLGGNQNNRLKFATYPAYGFGSYRFNGFYIPIDYKIKSKDYLTKKDIYPSANQLNRRYGIQKSKSTGKVR